MSLMTMMTGFGLATAAGGRAFLIALLLGIFHHTPYFELNSSFVWLASPPVMCVLGVVAFAEMYIDAHPELKEWAHYPSYMSSFIVGFIALSANTGSVDPNLLELVASGILGGATSSAFRYVRNTVTGHVDDTAEAVESVLGDNFVNKKRSWLENLGTIAFGASSILFPALVIIGVLGIIGFFFLYKKKNPQSV
jgi:hypothetical protein